jgi:multiple sugar transport system ATP-binding protein
LKVQAEGAFTGTVSLVEHLGNETIINLKLSDGQGLIVALDGDTHCAVGDTLSVGFAPAKAHLFNAGGERISG